MEDEKLQQELEETAYEEPEVEGTDAGEETAAEASVEEAAEEQGDRTEEFAEDGPGEKKSFFKRKEKKDKKDEKIEDLTDRLKRQMAEFDNFRKRTEKEKASMYEIGAKSVIEKILPVIDNFERGLAAVPEEQKEDSFVVGMDKIYKQILRSEERRVGKECM